MKRLGIVLAACTLATAMVAATGQTAPPSTNSVDNPVKINVLSVWAHPDDDASVIGPCGVWHQLYGIRCGIIMITRGEGGGNAVGSESGPALGLRRENEDRAAQYRSGTVDIFNLDKVDFFFNQSAPLTQSFWGHDDTLGRIVRIIRTTQPDIYIGFPPTPAAGHGNHQWAGRMVWEAVKAAADPSMFPDQLTGPHALHTWQVKKAFSGGSTAGTGGTTTAADCTTGFIPTPGVNLDTVTGVWTGYDSPYLWPAGNIQGMTAGSAKIWAQVASEGSSALPTQSRTMFQGTANPGCSRFAMTESFVPFQPNTNPDGTPNLLAGKDNAILYGATLQDPGGLPRGTLEYLTFSRFFDVAGQPFKATLHLTAPAAAGIAAGTVALTVPQGWTFDGSKPIAPIAAGGSASVDFVVVPGVADVTNNYKISALYTGGAITGYTDNVVRLVPAVEGRFHRWGKYAEFDSWLTSTAPEADRLGRSAAVQSIGLGETISLPVDVHNWSDTTESGTVTITAPSDFTLDATSKPYGPLAPGGDTQVTFTLTNIDTTLPGAATNDPGTTTLEKSLVIATSYSTPAASANETLTISVVPTTTIPVSATAPVMDGQADPTVYTGPALDLSRKWSGGACGPAGVDCGTSGNPGDPTSTYARAAVNGDNLYFFVHVRDDFQSFAVTPEECVAHWLADSVELMVDPRGVSSQNNSDTATAFKLGVFPFTNDPSNSNGNGANGPCWERDADNHPGYSTGPLAATVDAAPNAPGVQVVSTATWVGSNQTTVDHSYGAGGGYNLEVKIPLGDLPSAVGPTASPPTGDAATNTSDPQHLGLNIAVYDEDNTTAAGQTTLRHIDQSTRLAWSNDTGAVQADPFRWGHAYVPGYSHPAGRSTTPAAPDVGRPNLSSADSPQSIYQSARDGVPLAGATPAPEGDSIAITETSLTSSSAGFDVVATGTGTAHVFLWAGDHGPIPVWLTSCGLADDPPPDYGFTPCATTDGGIPPWLPDMQGRLIGDLVVPVVAGTQHVSIPLDATELAGLAATGSALVSFTTNGSGSQAFDIPLAQATVVPSQSSSTSNLNDPVTLAADVSGTNPFPGAPTGKVQFRVDGTDLGSPIDLDAGAHAQLSTTALPSGTHSITAVYLGDGDYAQRTSAALQHVTKGLDQQLADLPTTIGSFGLQQGLASSLNANVAAIVNALAAGNKGAACTQLAVLLGNTINAAGTKGLSYAEAKQLLAAGNAIGSLIPCSSSHAPAPQTEADLVDLMAQIAGFGLQSGYATDLINRTGQVANAVVSGNGACAKLRSLAQQVTDGTGKSGKLTAAQGAALSAAIAAIGTELGC